MKDESIFAGIKQFSGYQLHEEPGDYFKVYRYQDNSWIFIGKVKAAASTSNYKLFKLAEELGLQGDLYNE